jgi:hypothetical protein
LCDRFFGNNFSPRSTRILELIDDMQISSVGLSITEIEVTVHGYGNHMDDLTKVQIHQALEVS